MLAFLAIPPPKQGALQYAPPAELAMPPFEPWPRLTPAQKECLQRRTHSQFGEDLALAPLLLAVAHAIGGEWPGTFVELGAYDGVNISNTIALESCLGWGGLLIEANPSNFRRLQANTERGYRNASRVSLRHSAVCSKGSGGFVEFTIAGDNVAGQLGAMSAEYLRWWGAVNRANETTRVSCEPLSSLMAWSRLPSATLLSLDVEGAEEIVMETVDPADFAVILVEADGHDRAKDHRVHTRLTSARLRRMVGLRLGLNDVYLRADAHAAVRPLLSSLLAEAKELVDGVTPRERLGEWARGLIADAATHGVHMEGDEASGHAVEEAGSTALTRVARGS